MISLFSSPAQKENTIESDEARNRIQEVIERALLIPEPDMTNLPEGMVFAVGEAVTEKVEAAVDPWDALKEFMVHDTLTENAA